MSDFQRCVLPAMVGGLLALSPATTAQDQNSDTTKKCIDADKIVNYRIVSDELVHLEMQSQNDILLRLKRHCPQLYYHKYMSFTPVNGQLCARFDDVITRSGTPCRIDTFTEVAKGAVAPNK